MSAHIPRKVFAKSLVVTVAVPIVMACTHDEPPPLHPNPPAATTTATTTSASSSASVAATTTTPIEESSARVDWIVARVGAGDKCEARAVTACPTDAMCNPPPPAAYECPKDIARSSYPLNLQAIANSTQCKATYTDYGGGMTCPRGAMCNPPPPHLAMTTVPCPK